MALRLCFIVESFDSQIRIIFPHISLRDLPCHRTNKILFLDQVFPEALVGSFSLAPKEILDSNISLSFVKMLLLIVQLALSASQLYLVKK